MFPQGVAGPAPLTWYQVPRVLPAVPSPVDGHGSLTHKEDIRQRSLVQNGFDFAFQSVHPHFL